MTGCGGGGGGCAFFFLLVQGLLAASTWTEHHCPFVHLFIHSHLIIPALVSFARCPQQRTCLLSFVLVPSFTSPTLFPLIHFSIQHSTLLQDTLCVRCCCRCCYCRCSYCRCSYCRCCRYSLSLFVCLLSVVCLCVHRSSCMDLPQKRSTANVFVRPTSFSTKPYSPFPMLLLFTSPSLITEGRTRERTGKGNKWTGTGNASTPHSTLLFTNEPLNH